MEQVENNALNIVQLATLSDTFINSEVNELVFFIWLHFILIYSLQDWKRLLDVAEGLLRSPDHCGRTAAFFAAYAGNVVALEAILSADVASASVVDKMGWNAMHAAALSDQAEAARMLLESDRALAYSSDKLGRTPAILAAASGSHTFLEALYDEVCFV